MNSSTFELRLQFLLIVFFSALGLLGIRLFYLQVVQGDAFRTAAEANRTTVISERAPRGLILDRNGEVLADSQPTFVVLYNSVEMEQGLISEVIWRLSRILRISETDLREKLKPALKRSSLVRVMDRVSRRMAFALAEQQPNLPGVSVVIEMQRRYPHGDLAAHVLGYLGQINAREYKKLRQEGYHADSLIGKTGLEKVYDQILRGKNGGTRLEVDASGRSLKILDRKEPVSGYQIKTTLDLKVQQAAEQALAETKKAGAVIAMDPRNGEILAFASSPTFDPNTFVTVRGEEFEDRHGASELLKREDLPLFNRAIQGLYAPGSIFKIIDTAAALESKKVRPEDYFNCNGYYWLGGPGGKKFLCWKKKGHGKMTFTDGLVKSCNVFFYNVGLKVGPDPIEALARKFGLGEPSGLDLPGEKSGLISGRKMFQTDRRRWFKGDTLNMVIGQGTILFTPLQAVRMVSVVASRGKLYKPSILKEVRLPTGEIHTRISAELERQIKLSPSTWDFLDSALSQVVERGTGWLARIPGLTVAGKTGTAQNPHGDDHAWFVAYAPVEEPEIAVSVLVEHGKHGSVAAAPIARKVILAALGDRLRDHEQGKTVSAVTEVARGD